MNEAPHVHLYPEPSDYIRHTVSFCEICECQRTFSFGFCDHCQPIKIQVAAIPKREDDPEPDDPAGHAFWVSRENIRNNVAFGERMMRKQGGV